MNPRIVEAVRALRAGRLVPLEGSRALLEALDAGIRPVTAFLESPATDDSLLERLEKLGTTIHGVSGRVIARLSDLPSSRGVVALAEAPVHRLSEIRFGGNDLVLVLDGVQDPSNVGAIVRSAEAFGASSLLLTPGSANPYSARALRASAGSAFRLPVVRDVPAGEVIDWLRSRGAQLAGADVRGGVPPPDAGLSRPLALVIGSEGHGVSEPLVSALDAHLTIPLGGQVESLNAAVAAGILLYALSPKTSASNR